MKIASCVRTLVCPAEWMEIREGSLVRSRQAERELSSRGEAACLGYALAPRPAHAIIITVAGPGIAAPNTPTRLSQDDA